MTEWKDLQNLIRVSEEGFGDVSDVYVVGADITDTVRNSPFLLRPESLFYQVYLITFKTDTRVQNSC